MRVLGTKPRSSEREQMPSSTEPCLQDSNTCLYLTNMILSSYYIVRNFQSNVFFFVFVFGVHYDKRHMKPKIGIKIQQSIQDTMGGLGENEQVFRIQGMRETEFFPPLLSPDVFQTGLELVTLLPQLSKCWGYSTTIHSPRIRGYFIEYLGKDIKGKAELAKQVDKACEGGRVEGKNRQRIRGVKARVTGVRAKCNLREHSKDCCS